MAGLATSGKGAAVRVGMACATSAEGEPHVLWLAVGARQMAFLARHLLMQSGQRIARPAMIELPSWNRKNFPVAEAVALLAILPQPALVLVLVAGYAGARHAQVCPVEVLNGDCRALAGRDVRCIVTACARQSRVLAFQHVTGFAVVKGCWRRLPADKREIFAMVLRVAAGALLLAGADRAKRRVQPAFGRYSPPDVGVAFQAFETGCPRRQLVATGAVGGAGKRLVRARKRARRNLPPACRRQQCRQKNKRCERR